MECHTKKASARQMGRPGAKMAHFRRCKLGLPLIASLCSVIGLEQPWEDKVNVNPAADLKVPHLEAVFSCQGLNGVLLGS